MAKKKNMRIHFIARMCTGDTIFIYSCCASALRILHWNWTEMPSHEIKYIFTAIELEENKKFCKKDIKERKFIQNSGAPISMQDAAAADTKTSIYRYMDVLIYRPAIKTWLLLLLLIADAQWLPASPVSTSTCTSVCVCAYIEYIVGWWSLLCQRDVFV